LKLCATTLRIPIGRTATVCIFLRAIAGPASYAALSLSGYFSRRGIVEVKKMWRFASRAIPDRRTPGIEVASGSLGQGLSVA